MFAQKRIAPQIALWSLAHVVNNPVDLNAKLYRSTIEINHVGADRMLPAKFPSRRVAAQFPPQQAFRQRHIPA